MVVQGEADEGSVGTQPSIPFYAILDVRITGRSFFVSDLRTKQLLRREDR